MTNYSKSSFALSKKFNSKEVNTKIPEYKSTSVEFAPTKTENVDVDIPKIDYTGIAREGYTPQGYEYMDNAYVDPNGKAHNGYVIAAYPNPDGDAKGKSKLYFYNTKGKFQYAVELDNDAHVGGITYDSKSKKLYVTGKKGEINVYDNKELLRQVVKYRKNKPNITRIDEKEFDYKKIKVEQTDPMSVNKKTEVGLSSNICSDDSFIYVGTFDGNNKGQYIVFDKETGNQVGRGNLPSNTQGIAIKEYKGKKYLLASRSISSAKSSISILEAPTDELEILHALESMFGLNFKSRNTKLDYHEVGTYILDRPGAEQITIGDDDEIGIMYEREADGDKTDTSDAKDLKRGEYWSENISFEKVLEGKTTTGKSKNLRNLEDEYNARGTKYKLEHAKDKKEFKEIKVEYAKSDTYSGKSPEKLYNKYNGGADFDDVKYKKD